MDGSKKVAIVTGAAGNGIGRSAALTLAREGFAVVVNYRSSRAEAEAVVEVIRLRGGDAVAVQANVFLGDDCARLVAAAIEAYGRVDVCVIGPGAGWNPESLFHLKGEAAIRDAEQEVAPIYHLMPHLLRDMAKRGWGRVIGIALNMDVPSPSLSYNAAKLGRLGALRLAADEAWKIRVTVNAVAPSPVDGFGSLAQACAHCFGGWEERDERISPQDVAEGIAFLCSPAADFITGCALPYRH